MLGSLFCLLLLSGCGPYPSAELGEETVPADEHQHIRRVIDMFREQVAARDTSGITRRGAHPKHHGCAVGEFVIDDIDEAHNSGLFKPHARYPLIVRFSNNADPQSDAAADVRGMAMKLFNVPGERLFQPESVATTFDLLLVSHPVFLFADVATYTEAFAAFARDEALEFFFNPLNSHVRSFLIARKMLAQHGALDQIRWHSMVPYAFGQGRAVKYAAWSCEVRTSPPIPPDQPDFLGQRLGQQLKEKGICFHFGVQFQTDARRMPIEDPRVQWSERESPVVPLARIELPPQDLERSTSASDCENLSFNPWRALPEHRPLGGISRARREIYEAMSNYRAERNRLARTEPTQAPSLK